MLRAADARCAASTCNGAARSARGAAVARRRRVERGQAAEAAQPLPRAFVRDDDGVSRAGHVLHDGLPPDVAHARVHVAARRVDVREAKQRLGAAAPRRGRAQPLHRRLLLGRRAVVLGDVGEANAGFCVARLHAAKQRRVQPREREALAAVPAQLDRRARRQRVHAAHAPGASAARFLARPKREGSAALEKMAGKGYTRAPVRSSAPSPARLLRPPRSTRPRGPSAGGRCSPTGLDYSRRDARAERTQRGVAPPGAHPDASAACGAWLREPRRAIPAHCSRAG